MRRRRPRGSRCSFRHRNAALRGRACTATAASRGARPPPPRLVAVAHPEAPSRVDAVHDRATAEANTRKRSSSPTDPKLRNLRPRMPSACDRSELALRATPEPGGGVVPPGRHIARPARYGFDMDDNAEADKAHGISRLADSGEEAIRDLVALPLPMLAGTLGS